MHIAVKSGYHEVVKSLMAAAFKRKLNLNLPDKVLHNYSSILSSESLLREKTSTDFKVCEPSMKVSP